MPFGPVSRLLQPSQAHLAASAPFRARHLPVSGRLSRPPPRRRGSMRVLVSRCLSAAGLRFSAILSRQGIPPLLRSACRPQVPDPDGVSTFRTHEIRPDWAPSVLRDQRCSHEPGGVPGPPPAALLRHGSCTPALPSSIQGRIFTEHQSRVHTCSPARPSPHLWPPDDSGALGLYPGLRTRASRTRARTPGQGQAQSTSLELHHRHLRHASPPSCEFTRTCATSCRTTTRSSSTAGAGPWS